MICSLGLVGSKDVEVVGKRGDLAIGWSLRVLDNGLVCMFLAFSYILAKEKAFITKVG